jgi:hypothetical protein
MSYGLKIRDSAGAVVLNVTDRITRFVWVSDVITSAGSQVLPQLQGLETVEFAFMVELVAGGIAPTVSRSGNTISWTTYSSAPSVIFVFSYT